MRTRTQFIVAVAMFAACLGIGSMADVLARGAVSWLATDADKPGHPLLSIQSRPHGVRISNLTDERWNNCVVVVDGGYRSPAIAIDPRARVVMPYTLFAMGSSPLSDRGGFGRAFRSTAVTCTDSRQHQQVAELR